MCVCVCVFVFLCKAYYMMYKYMSNCISVIMINYGYVGIFWCPKKMKGTQAS
jgi:hypothetical protein